MTPRDKALKYLQTAKQFLDAAQVAVDSGDPLDSSDNDLDRAIQAAQQAINPVLRPCRPSRMGWVASAEALKQSGTPRA